MAPARQNDDTSALLRERVRRVFKEFPGALSGEEEAVHQVRVAGRRLHVALPLLARKTSGRRLRRARRILSELIRAAGTGRDLDVMVGLYEKRLGKLEAPTSEQREILRRMRVACSRSHARLADGILDLDIDRLRRDLRKIRGRGTARGARVLRRTQAVRERQGERLLKQLADVGRTYDPEALHALRRRVRRLRYTAEMEDRLRGTESGAADTWKSLQDSIGALHDIHVLAGWLGRQARRAGEKGDRALAAAARAERSLFETEGRRLHRKLLASGPAEIIVGALGVDTPEAARGTSRKDGPVPSSGGNGRSRRSRGSGAYPRPNAV